MSSVFNDSEGLYRTTVYRCLVRRPHFSAADAFRALTEIAWKDAVAPEKNRALLNGTIFYRRRVLQRATSLRVASISRARPPENLIY